LGGRDATAEEWLVVHLRLAGTSPRHTRVPFALGLGGEPVRHPLSTERLLMDTPRELFLHELGDILFAERTLVKTLPKLAKEASDSSLSTAIEKHLTETEGHVSNVEAAFKAIGETPKAEKCPGIEGITKEHDEFVSKEDPSSDVLDMFLTGAAARTEHYEIAAYTGLITMADALGETDAAKLLGENLKQEKAALQTVTGISEKLASQAPSRA
jgi:ferritin-like metal-binding protein YciE